MNVHIPTPTAAKNRHPVDALKDTRNMMKALEAQEKELKTLISGDRESRVGDEYHAIVSERSRDTTDWKGLALKLGASEAAIAAATKTSTYEVVELSTLPDLADVLRLLTEEYLAVVDCETTGFSPAKGDRIVSVAALPTVVFVVDGVAQLGVCEEEPGVSVLINPGRPSSPQALAVHGLTEAFLADKPAFSEIAEGLIEKLEVDESVIVAHNAPFDMGFLNAEFERCGMKPLPNPVIDTRVLSKVLWPGEPASLDDMCERLGVDRLGRDQRHDALEDCRVLAACLPGLVKLIQERLAA